MCTDIYKWFCTKYILCKNKDYIKLQKFKIAFFIIFYYMGDIIITKYKSIDKD